jgi:hypothetical protein
MEKALESSLKKEAMDPIIMDVIARFSSPHANFLRRPFPFPYEELKFLFCSSQR